MFQGIAAYIRTGIKADLEGRGIEPDQNKFAVLQGYFGTGALHLLRLPVTGKTEK